MAQAQLSLDSWSVEVADERSRPGGTVGEVGAAEPLRRLPPLAYPAVISVERKVSRSALVAFEANLYSVPPFLAGRTVRIRATVGSQTLAIVSRAGEIVAEHRRAPAGAGQRLRTTEHAQLLEKAVLAAFTTGADACRQKVNRPPGTDALAALAKLNGLDTDTGNVRSLADYQQQAEMATLQAVAPR